MKHFKQLLLAKQSELQAEIARFESEARVGGEAEVRDSGDAATVSQNISEALQEGSVLSQTLFAVQDALRRIDAGTFGTCVACDRQIEPARLEAIPWTPYCLADQEKRDEETRAPRGSTL